MNPSFQHREQVLFRQRSYCGTKVAQDGQTSGERTSIFRVLTAKIGKEAPEGTPKTKKNKVGLKSKNQCLLRTL